MRAPHVFASPVCCLWLRLELGAKQDSCRFCHKWFYGENELWKHMADTHESCFLCKRKNPDRHVYYKDYEELEGELHRVPIRLQDLCRYRAPCHCPHGCHCGLAIPATLLLLGCSACFLGVEHFRHEHYLCEDTICRQEHFQVWTTEAELHQHRVRVHGDHMSRHEKRQALRIRVDINVSRTSSK